MGKLSDDDLKTLLEYLEQIGQDPDLELTKELQGKINLILAMHRAGRIVVAKDGSAAIGGDATGNTFNLAPVFYLHSQERPILEEVIAIHNFDLSELLDECLDHLLVTPNGVVGFGLRYNVPKLLPSICERIRIRLDCDSTAIKDHIALDRSYAAGIDDVVKDILLTHIVAKMPNTIFSVQTFENEAALALWRQIKSIESRIPVDTRLILIMVVEENFSFPTDMHELHSPIFRPAHVQEFFMKIVSTRKKNWSASKISIVVSCWIQSLIDYCTYEGVLYQKTVYHYLKITIDEFKRNTDPDNFIAFLDGLEELKQGA